MISHILTKGREARTSQLEQHALTSRDLCTSLVYPLEGPPPCCSSTRRPRGRTRHGCPRESPGRTAAHRHATTQLIRNTDCPHSRSTTHLAAHEDERFKFVFLEQEGTSGRRSEECLFFRRWRGDAGRVRPRQVDAIVGLSKGYDRSRNA